MEIISIREAKANLSKLIARVVAGKRSSSARPANPWPG
jgi:antitoxin (DNA-binding transcriptional repressor) of toxin-antitoxin stability system